MNLNLFIVMFYLSGSLLLLISLFMMLISLWMLFYSMNFMLEWYVYSMNSSYFNMFIYLDWMTLMFLFTVMFISSMIMFYCSEYMNHDLTVNRFIYILILFIISMMFMILSPNLVSILIGWDGLGLTSYCLVIYYQNYMSFNSGMLTILLNRIGDIMLIMSVSLMFSWGSWSFMYCNYLSMLMIFMVIISAFTKSAQFPFSSWLPMAMAAPTPVSSLVHSSTLVTAGVYLLIRFNFLLEVYSNMMMYIMITGLLTMMMAGMCAMFEYDLKKIIAYSTLSQLGLMMIILSMSNIELTFFHLVVHAMFKSMMFMCSGIMIHSLLNYQDIRYMGNLKMFMPMTSMMFMIGNFSLCGMPFMSGFYSKDQILENIFMNSISSWNYLCMLLSTGLTVMYSVRLSYFLMSKNLNFLPQNMIYDNKIMNFSMMMLMFLAIFMGYFMNLLLFFNIEKIFLMGSEKNIILLVCIIFIIFGLIMYLILLNFKVNYFMKFFMGKMWFLYNFNIYFMLKMFNFSGKFFKNIDKGWSEYFLKESIYLILNKMNWLISKNIIIMNLLFSLMYLLMLLIVNYYVVYTV